MRKGILYGLMCILAVGCAKKEVTSVAPQSDGLMGSAKVAGEERQRYMAYEHFIALNVDEAQVASIRESVEAACLAALSDECVVLVSNLRGGNEAFADIKLRAKAKGIKKIAAMLITKGKVIQQTVEAEDLAEKIIDTTRRLKLHKDYRAQLEILRNRPGNDIESLIKVSKELSEVQSQIEDLSSEEATQNRRVNTELLSIAISSNSGETFWRPVGAALGDFKIALGQGIASVISFLAFLLPWGMLLSAIWFVVSKIMSTRRRRTKS